MVKTIKNVASKNKKNTIKRTRSNTIKKGNTKKEISKALNIQLKDILYLNDIEVSISNYCVKHPTFIITKSDLKNKIRKIKNNEHNKLICPVCNPIDKSSSIQENEVRHFIEKELHIESKKIKLQKSEIDIYLPEHNLGIEYNGLWWHSSKFRKSNYHLNKTELSEKNNIKLLQIFEDEWTNKKDIVKSIIKSKLKIYDKKIYSRYCEVKEVEMLQASAFLAENDLFGSSNTLINYGLYFKNELVSILSIQKNNFNSYEITGHCDKLNVYVSGSLDKLIKHFIYIHKPKSLIKNVDRRYSQGESYRKIGFKNIKNTRPNFLYFSYKKKNMNRKSLATIKEQYPDYLIDYQANSEEILMEQLGYYRIYDCGCKKFVLNLK